MTELTDEQFIALADDIDASITELCMEAYDKYDIYPLHLVSIMLGRMSVLMRETNELDKFKRIMETAVNTINSDTEERKLH